MFQVVFQLSYHSIHERISMLYIYILMILLVNQLAVIVLVSWNSMVTGLVGLPGHGFSSSCPHHLWRRAYDAHHPCHGCLFPLFARVPHSTFMSSLSPLLEVPFFTTRPLHLGPWPLEVSRALTFSMWSTCAWKQPVQLWLILESNPAWCGVLPVTWI